MLPHSSFIVSNPIAISESLAFFFNYIPIFHIYRSQLNAFFIKYTHIYCSNNSANAAKSLVRPQFSYYYMQNCYHFCCCY